MVYWDVANNLLLTEREGRTGEYWPEVVAVRTEYSEVRTKTTEGQHCIIYFANLKLDMETPLFKIIVEENNFING